MASRSINRRSLLLASSFLLLGRAAASAPATFGARRPVILSTDLSTDVGDVKDVALMAYWHNAGLIDLIGVVIDSPNAYAADCAYAILKFMNPDAWPRSVIGAYKGRDPRDETSPFTYDISIKFGSGQNRARYIDAIQLMRSLLTRQTNPVAVV